MNDDGNVDVSDVISLIDMVLNSSAKYEVNADMSMDDTVDIEDVSMLIDKILGN